MTTNTNNKILVNNVSFCYRKGNYIFNNITLEINPSDRIAIIGKNGSGKTTLIETILGLNSPTTGKIVYPKELLNSTGCVFQDVDFDNEVKISKIFIFFAKLVGLIKTNLSEAELLEIFSKYEMGEKMNRRYTNLSGGEKQKFKLLLCLELKPKVLFLDELTTALDYEWRRKILVFIQRYLDENPSSILILISHSRDEIEKLTTTRYLLKDKKLTKIIDLDSYFD